MYNGIALRVNRLNWNVIPGDTGLPVETRDPPRRILVGPGSRDAKASLGRDDNRV